ncbi:hypothetical protein [Streptomyces sp. NPDC000134]|uniref:hypothetical protein n=1 Tax=Streptomyces sp. NPDC000134 TaxID=3364536 RepID=UPI0036A3396C
MAYQLLRNGIGSGQEEGGDDSPTGYGIPQGDEEQSEQDRCQKAETAATAYAWPPRGFLFPRLDSGVFEIIRNGDLKVVCFGL